MFSLFYGLWKYVFTKDEFRVLMLGVDKAGKTVISPGLSFLITRIQYFP
jgi:ADP-ribosylation factor related protein 1